MDRIVRPQVICPPPKKEKEKGKMRGGGGGGGERGGGGGRRKVSLTCYVEGCRFHPAEHCGFTVAVNDAGALVNS